MIKNFFEVNDLIADKLQSNEPFSVLRIDNTATYVINCLTKGERPVHQFYNENTMIEGGVIPSNLDYAFSVVYPKTLEVMKSCDILGFVDVSNQTRNDQPFLNLFPDKPLFFDVEAVDPGGLTGRSVFGKLDNPWTKYLKGKKVLVISSHANTIKEQWKKIDQIWGDERELIAPFELVDCIKTPFHPAVDDRQYPDCHSFEDLIQRTKDIIDTYEYDVLLSGVTTQSPFYAEHAKERGNVGIQTGGIVQLFFGIIGKRWEINYKAYYPNGSNMFNEHWTYPLKIDEPQKINDIRHLETSYAYWSGQ